MLTTKTKNMMTAAEENVLRIQNQKLHEQIELMQKLCTAQKFYAYYFSKLSGFPSNKACFDYVNEQYFDCFSQYRFSNYEVFRVMLSRENNKNRTK